MKTIRDILFQCINYLEKKGVERARRESEDLLCDALGLKRVALYMQLDQPLTEAEIGVCRERVMRRGRGEPLAYIHGEVDFGGCRISVSPAVLIPRQETEQLLELVLRRIDRSRSGIAWDICCGSGCLGIALKRKLPLWTIVLSDISSEAIQLARRNASANQVEGSFREGDLLQPFVGEKADLIVCNPPYISQTDYSRLSPEVRDFEPKHALLAGSTGLEYYQRLVAEGLHRHLNPGGQVWLEIGADQGVALQGLLDCPPWKQVRLIQDWSGRDRFFSLEIE